MAQVLIVVYELHKDPPKDYEEIVKIIKQYDYLKIGGSEYCIYTSDTPQIVFEKLKAYFHKTDRLLIIKTTNPKFGLLTPDEWKWLDDRIAQSH